MPKHLLHYPQIVRVLQHARGNSVATNVGASPTSDSSGGSSSEEPQTHSGVTHRAPADGREQAPIGTSITNQGTHQLSGHRREVQHLEVAAFFDQP